MHDSFLAESHIEEEVSESPQTENEKHREQREALLVFLNKKGVYREVDGVKVWDIPAVQALFRKENNQPTVPAEFRRGNSQPKKMNKLSFAALLRDEQGVSKGDMEQALKDGHPPVPRSLFYVPYDAEATFDIEAIKKDRSMMGVWDLGAGRVTDWNAPVELVSGEAVPLNEIFLAKKIYGDLRGHRNKKGELMVWDEEAKQERKFTAEWFQEKTGFMGGGAVAGKQNEKFTNPAEYLARRGKNLVAHDLLRPSDFRMLRESSGKMFRGEHAVSANGMVFLNGAYYTLGRALAGSKIAELTSDMAAVIRETPSGDREITHTFPLKTKDEIEEKRQELSARAGKEIKGAGIFFGKNEVGLREFRATADNKPLPGETIQDYAERVMKLGSFRATEKLSTRMSVEAGIGIHDKLTWREQQWLSAASEHGVDQDEMVAASKKFGVDFLKTFLSCEYGLEQGKIVIELAEQLPPDTARAIFARYSELVTATEQVERYLEETFKRDSTATPADREAIAERLLRRGKDLLVHFAGQSKASDAIQTGVVLKELDHFRTDVLLFVSAFKVLFKDKGEVNFSDVKGLELETKTLNDLRNTDDSTQALVEQMVAVHAQNRLDQGEAGKASAKKLKELLHSGKADTQFYILKKDGKLLSFLRFDDIPERPRHKYFASFNVARHYQGGGIGEAMYFTILEREIKENPGTVFEFIFYTKSDAGNLYVNAGSIITGLDASREYFTAERSVARSKDLRSIKMPQKDLVDLRNRQQGATVTELIAQREPVVVKTFAVKEDDDAVKTIVEQLTAAGYVGARFFYENVAVKTKRSYVFELEKVKPNQVIRPEILRQAA